MSNRRFRRKPSPVPLRLDCTLLPSKPVSPIPASRWDHLSQSPRTSKLGDPSYAGARELPTTDSLASIPHAALLFPFMGHAMSACKHRIHRRADSPAVLQRASPLTCSFRSTCRPRILAELFNHRTPLPASHSHRQSW
jgi:hypothetical protein